MVWVKGLRSVVKALLSYQPLSVVAQAPSQGWQWQMLSFPRHWQLKPCSIRPRYLWYCKHAGSYCVHIYTSSHHYPAVPLAHVIFEQVDFIAKLAALVPKPRVNLIRLHDVFAPNSKHRAWVTPARRVKGSQNVAHEQEEKHPAPPQDSLLS